MLEGAAVSRSHPEGEKVFDRIDWPIDTPGGRYYAEFDDAAPVTREGQLIFFAQFLHTAGLWERFLSGTPLAYEGNRGSAVGDVLGTAVLSILCGHWRYAHIDSVRGDRLNPGLLGMRAPVSEDVVRRAMKRIEEGPGLRWLGGELQACLEPVLSQPWIMDIDVTVKCIYGHQEGASLGHNPHKPGRPSHSYHSYFMANTRLCLGVDVLGGKEHASRHGQPGLWAMLERLPRTHWPTMLRGDCGYGQDQLLSQAEARGLPCLFKLRHTAKVKALVSRAQHQGATWQEAGDGWQVMESTLRLSGWSCARRVVLVREAPAVAPVGAQARRRRDYHQALPGSEHWPQESAPWSGRIAVLVTTLDANAYPAQSLARLYRERADAENIYDELKNQWGWNGFTTRTLGPCRLMANLVALVYNWWHLYVRLYDADRHREAITSRPALLGGVARLTRHSGQSTVKVSLQHEKRDALVVAITQVSSTLHRFHAIAQQWPQTQRWSWLLTHIFRRWLGGRRLAQLPPEAELILSG